MEQLKHECGVAMIRQLMSRFITALLLFCAASAWAQSPLLTTKWTQDYPYNMLCPADPLENNKHSYAGCPAVTMGQIINHLHTTQNTRFDDNDDYFTGNYFGRQFHIDDDWATYQFPSFPQLNVLLDSVDSTFHRGGELTDSLKAAVVFACGIACQQVYSASSSYGSGTFSVNQAFEAYQRFGFTNCQLFQEPDSTMYALLISNLQAGYPAHLAVENPAGTSGHNDVVDGYRESDGKFHLNFGWGGPKDDWYQLPDPNGFSYGWTKIEGLIVNLIPSTGPMTVHEPARPQWVEAYPNPATDLLHLKGLPCTKVEYAIFDLMGQKAAAGTTDGTISVAELKRGIYLLQLKGDDIRRTIKIVVK